MSNLARAHHVGITVHDIDRSVRFWEAFLETPPRWRRLLDGAYLSDVTGYRNVRLDAAVFELPGGLVLEILEYLDVTRLSNPEETANPGNVHLCLESARIEVTRDRAIAAGAKPISPRVIDVAEGPNAGARACYLRDPDGITIELFQPPPATT